LMALVSGPNTEPKTLKTTNTGFGTHFAIFFFQMQSLAPTKMVLSTPSKQESRPNSGKTETLQFQICEFRTNKKNAKGFLPSSPNPPQFGASVVQDQR